MTQSPLTRYLTLCEHQLVDELYDQSVTLVLHSPWPLEVLYQEGALTFEFHRTYSRLVEMRRWLEEAQQENVMQTA